MSKEQEFEKGASKATIGYTNEDYKKALGNTPYETNTGDATTDYYNALKNESYKTLLNSEVQASIARDQALKYTNNNLRNRGYANQGIAESTNLGLQSQYQTALANASNNYQTSIRQIDEQQQAAQTSKQNDDFNSVTTLMSGAMDSSQLNDIVSTYGYGSLNDDGTMNWAKLDESNLDENSKNQIKILYNMYNSQFGTDTGLNSLDALNNETYIGNSQKIYRLGDRFSEEMKYLWHKASKGSYKKGEAIAITNGEKETVYMQWTGSGFKQIDYYTYENESAHQYTLKWEDKKINYNN